MAEFASAAQRLQFRDPERARRLSRALAERTAEVIRQRILTLAPGFQPGDRLYPGKLAELLDVSVTPIREALKLLAAEGLVEFSPRRGASVTALRTMCGWPGFVMPGGNATKLPLHVERSVFATGASDGGSPTPTPAPVTSEEFGLVTVSS